MAQTKQLISSTPDAHSDFVKCFLVIPSLNLLVSGGSDKMGRFWYALYLFKLPFSLTSRTRDLSSAVEQAKPLQNAGSISSHTRPIACLAGHATSATTAVLYTADTMGVLRVWKLEKQAGAQPVLWRASTLGELKHHRTRINDLALGQGLIWTGLFSFYFSSRHTI